MRKKHPQRCTSDDNDGDFFILGDQTIFRLNMPTYRTRSLSAPRYSDSPDMLTWINQGDNDDDVGGDHHHQHHHRHDDDHREEISDHHYHKCDDQLQRQPMEFHGNSRHGKQSGPGLNVNEMDNNNNNRNSNNKTGDISIPPSQPPNKVHLLSTSTKNKNTKNQKPTLSSAVNNPKSSQKSNLSKAKYGRAMSHVAGKTGLKSKPSVNDNNKQHKPNNPSNHTNKERSGALLKGVLKVKPDQKSREFVSKSDVGKFLSETHKVRSREEKLKASQIPNKDTKGATFGKPTNIEELMGKVILDRSQENKENLVNSQKIDSHHHHEQYRRPRSISEYQDKFQWKADHRLSLTPPKNYANLNRSHPTLSWLQNDIGFSNSHSEYHDQFRPTSATLFEDRKFNHHHHHHRHHHRNVLRDHGEMYSRDNIARGSNHRNGIGGIDGAGDMDRYTRPKTDRNVSRGINGQGSDSGGSGHGQGGDSGNGRHGNDGGGLSSPLRADQLTSEQNDMGYHHHHDHHNPLSRYKSEYTVKFVPPSDYLLVDGIWMKTNHPHHYLGNSLLTTKDHEYGIQNFGNPEYKKNSNDFLFNGSNQAYSTLAPIYGGRTDAIVDNIEPAGGDNGNVAPFLSTSTNVANSFSNNRNNNVAYVSNSLDLNAHGQHHVDSWFDYILQLRKKAEEYKTRGFGTTFSREHLVQIPSKNLHYWDASSDETSTADENRKPSKSYQGLVRSGERNVNIPNENETSKYENKEKLIKDSHDDENDAAMKSNGKNGRSRTDMRTRRRDGETNSDNINHHHHHHHHHHPLHQNESLTKSHSTYHRNKNHNDGENVSHSSNDDRHHHDWGHHNHPHLSSNSFPNNQRHGNSHNPLIRTESRRLDNGKQVSRDFDDDDGDDSDARSLSDTLSSARSLAEEVLERAKSRKNQLWSTK